MSITKEELEKIFTSSDKDEKIQDILNKVIKLDREKRVLSTVEKKKELILAFFGSSTATIIGDKISIIVSGLNNVDLNFLTSKEHLINTYFLTS